jgi:thiopurine S-methyltransferase
MTSRDNQLWLQSWRDNHIDFHQITVNQLLTKFWPKLDITPSSKVFVPLCGKSLDMIWLSEQGHQVIGVELSPIAIRDFFKENGFKPVKKSWGHFTLWQYKQISILCGDYFSLSKDDLGEIDIVYDRASLTALPEDIRKRYVEHLKIIVQDTTKVFILTTEDAEENETLKHALGIDEEISDLYSKDFEINLAHVDSIYDVDSERPSQLPGRTEYKVYQLCRKPDF